MDSILKCFSCIQNFDLTELAPRVLPCNNSICLRCIQNSKQLIGGFLIKCKCSKKEHKIKSLDELYPCNMITNYLELQRESANSLDNLKKQLENAKFSLEMAKYEADKHYDSVEINIDIKAEYLISLIHEKRDLLHIEIKQFRRQTDHEFESIKEKHKNDIKALESSYETIFAENLAESDSQLKKSFDSLQKMHHLLVNFNRIQRPLEDIKTNMWYFSENVDLLDTSLLGKLLNKNFEANYFKIKQLSDRLKDKDLRHEISLETNFTSERLKHYIIPLNRYRIISAYFTSKRSILLELFDQTGGLIKTVEVADNVAYYPVIANNSNKFIISFLSQHNPVTNENYADSVSQIHLYDQDLNLIKAKTERHLIESICMTKTNIICTFPHKSTNCCKLYDLAFNEIDKFGQQSNPESPFYFKKSILDRKDLKAKVNPIIFGFSSTYIYTYSKEALVIMCRKTGEVFKKYMKKHDDVIYFLDAQSNLVEVNAPRKEIGFNKYDADISCQSGFELEAHDVFLIEDNFLAFVDIRQQLVTIV